MKKLSVIILTLVLLAAQMDTAVQAQPQNIIQSARILTDIPEKSGYPIGNIADGRTNTPAVLDNTLSLQNFPYYIEFDFGMYTASLTYLKIYSMFGADAGITNFDIQAAKNGEWIDIKRGVELKWDTSSSAVEDRTVYFSDKPISNKFRLMINGANLSWNEFRIDELELAGEISGLTDKKEITAFKTPYLIKSTTGNITLPDKITAKTSDNTETELEVQWEMPDTSAEGIYCADGSITYYDDIPKAVIDVYDINKDISAYENNWAYGAVKKAVQAGLLGSVDTTMANELICGEIALIVFRKAGMQLGFLKNNYSDIENDVKYYMYDAVVEAGFFDGINSGEFNPENSMTRMEAVKLMTKYTQQNGGTKITECDMAYTDIDALSAADKEILKTAYEYGIIKNAAQFRPNDTVTLGEFLSIAPSVSGSDGFIEKEFTDNGKILKNPNMGFFSYYTDNGTMKYDVDYPNSEYFESVTGLSNVYIRTPWVFFEPNRDEYDFSLIDGAIEKFKRAGLQISLRITVSETGDEYATPKWVFEDGAKEIRWDTNKGGISSSGNAVMPDYDDPVFLNHLDDFVGELAKRYDGNPNIAYIDLGSLGVWGEGHTSNSGVSISESAVRAQLDIYSKHFKKTKVLLLDNTHNFMNVKEYAIEKGFGYRNDSFTGTFDQAPYWTRDRLERLEGMWQKAPVAMELTHYDWMKTNDYWKGGEGLYSLLWDNHATYLGLHGYSLAMEEENHELFEKLSRRIGYRILPEQVSMSAKAEAQGVLSFKALWKNLGVAPCYDGAYPAVTLKDKEGNIVSVMVDSSFNVNTLAVAQEGYAEGIMQEKNFRLHGLLPGGVYEVYLSLGSIAGTPQIAMPIDGGDGERRYYLGDITVEGMYKVSAVQKGAGALELTFDVSDFCGDYDYVWPRLDFFDIEKGERKISGDYVISLRDRYEEFEEAIKTKSSFVCGVNVNPSAAAAGKTYNVYYSMHNLSNGNTYGFMVSDNGRYCLLGTAHFDENLNFTFTPAE